MDPWACRGYRLGKTRCGSPGLLGVKTTGMSWYMIPLVCVLVGRERVELSVSGHARHMDLWLDFIQTCILVVTSDDIAGVIRKYI